MPQPVDPPQILGLSYVIVTAESPLRPTVSVGSNRGLRALQHN
jgi:hypothetical protein